jgi:uncharacterized protein
MTFFEWDEGKARSNYRKHRVRFDDAIEVFHDPHALMEQDRVTEGELRWQTIGSVAGVIVLLVAHTMRDEGADEIVRIISARRADRKERRRYEQSRTETLE